MVACPTLRKSAQAALIRGMVDHIAIGILSRLRPVSLRRCITSIISTVGANYDIYVAYDDDSISPSGIPPYPSYHPLVLQPRHYYVRALNALYSWMKAENENLDYFALINDDIEFTLVDWAKEVTRLMSESWSDGMGVVELCGRENCANIVTRKQFVEDELDGVIANSVYTMYFSDTELLNHLQAIKRIVAARTARNFSIATHHEDKDVVRLEALPWYEEDKRIYDKRKTRH